MRQNGLYVEQKLDDIAVLHHILFAFRALKALGFYGLHIEIARGKVIVSDNAGADKAALKVGMDFAGGLRRFGRGEWSMRGIPFCRRSDKKSSPAGDSPL